MRSRMVAYQMRNFLIVLFVFALSFYGMCYPDPSFGFAQSKELIFAALLSLLPTAGVGFLLSRSYYNIFNSEIMGDIKTITGRLSHIRQGDYNLFVDYPPDGALAPLINTINYQNKDMHETLRRLTVQKRKNDYIMDTMDSALLLVDEQGIVQQYNSALCKFFGVPKDSGVGQPLAQFITYPLLVNAVFSALENENYSVFDLVLQDSEGTVLSVSVSPVSRGWTDERTAKQGAGAAMVVANEVTQSRKLEEMRSEFIANLSHELKTPITSVRGFAELLLADMVQERDKQLEYLGRIHREAERMDDIIADILLLAEIENKNEAESHEWLPLAPICESIFLSLSPETGRRGITCTLKGAASVYAKNDDMHQLLKNVIENAVKYNRDGGTVDLRLTQNAFRCFISVADSGIGIPLEQQSRIFERFYRVDKARSTQRGTGLGLAIVKSIVQKYQGGISLTSRPDEGTTMRITLPLNSESENRHSGNRYYDAFFDGPN